MMDVAGGPVELVWRNEVGGLTGRVDGAWPRFVKWNPLDSGESLAAEARRLRWLAGRHPAPEVIDYRRVGDVELLVTVALPGLSAVDPIWLAHPVDAIRAIATGLRVLHAMPTRDCPYDWGVAARLATADQSGRTLPAKLHEPPEVDKLVVCHGDACAPNTLLSQDGQFLATVDLARLGVADRWADLAVATMSLGWNYPAFDEGLFWETYGIEPDVERIGYYRALYRAT
jgi:kanamycin kinase